MIKHEKRDLVNSFKQEIDGSVVLLLEHTKLPFSAFDAARRNAKAGTKIKKVKNRLAKIAFEGTNYSALNADLEDERLLIISNDLFEACQSARFFLENNKENVKVHKGASQDAVYDSSTILALAQISSVEELQSKMLRAIKVVGENLLRVIKLKFDENKE